MDAVAQTVPLVVPVATTRKSNWIESARFDLAFFSLSPVTVLPLVLLVWFVDRRLGLLFFLLSFPHYMSTASFFLWDEYQDRFRARWLAFYGGPVLIAASFFLLIWAGLPRIIQVVLFTWNIYHVARQNCGILSIYRHGAGVTDASQKSATNLAIVSASFLLAFWNVDTHDAFDPLRALRPDWSSWLRAGLAALTLVAAVRLGISLARRTRDGRGVRAPEALLLLTSLSFFHPFLWIRTSNAATAVMLLPHYLQYLGIVWLLQRRRFRESDGSARQRALVRVSQSTPILLAVLLAIGGVTIAMNLSSRWSGHEMVFESFYLLVALEHFYLDGLFWAFRDPAVRSSFGPFLIGYGASGAPSRAAA